MPFRPNASESVLKVAKVCQRGRMARVYAENVFQVPVSLGYFSLGGASGAQVRPEVEVAWNDVGGLPESLFGFGVIPGLRGRVPELGQDHGSAAGTGYAKGFPVVDHRFAVVSGRVVKFAGHRQRHYVNVGHALDHAVLVRARRKKPAHAVSPEKVMSFLSSKEARLFPGGKKLVDDSVQLQARSDVQVRTEEPVIYGPGLADEIHQGHDS